MIADVIEINGFRLAVLDTCDHAADAGLAFGARAEAGRIGQQALEKLDRHDLLAVEVHRLDAGHTHVAEYLQVFQVALAKAHPELGTLQAGEVFHQRFQLFVVHAIDVVSPHAVRTGEGLPGGHRRSGDELAVFPVTALGGHFADVDLRVEVGGKRIAVIAAVDVDNVQGMDLVEVVLGDVGGKHVGGAGIEPGTEQSHQPRLFKFVLIGPLPAVLVG